MCGIAAISVAREFSKESAASRERDAVAWLAITPRLDSARAAPSSGGSGGGNGNGSGGRDDEYAIIIGDDGNNTGSGLTNEDDDLAAGEEGDTDVRTKRKVARGKSGMVRRARQRLATGQSSVAVDPPGPTRLARKVYFFTRLICGTGMAAALLICVVIVAFAPHAPGVNVCNTQFDWVSERGLATRFPFVVVLLFLFFFPREGVCGRKCSILGVVHSPAGSCWADGGPRFFHLVSGLAVLFASSSPFPCLRRSCYRVTRY